MMHSITPPLGKEIFMKRSALNVMFAAIAILSSISAFGKQIECSGTEYGMRDHVLITLDFDDRNALACVIPNNVPAWLQLKEFCSDDNCRFRGHVIAQDGNTYTIDRILGPSDEDRQK